MTNHKQDYADYFPAPHFFSVTAGALKAVTEASQSPQEFLARHLTGDWGEICPADVTENERALREGFRLMSVYRTANGVKLFLITEADHSHSTLLLPDEY